MIGGDLGPELERLPGVLAATVFPDAPGGPRVYLAVRPGVDNDALRTATLALLQDRGVVTPHDRIHIGTAPGGPPVTTTLPSLALDALDVHRTGNRVECTARVRAPNRFLSASETDADTPTGRARAAARAVLSAVETLDPDLRIGLHGARTHDLFGQPTVLVLVEVAAGRRLVQLPGSALVERSIEQAAALATLQALRSWTP